MKNFVSYEEYYIGRGSLFRL